MEGFKYECWCGGGLLKPIGNILFKVFLIQSDLDSIEILKNYFHKFVTSKIHPNHENT